MSEPEMPDDVRAELERHFERAENAGLDPEWHDDGCGFWFDCPGCKEQGITHRSGIRALPVLRVTNWRPPGGGHGTARGPAG